MIEIVSQFPRILIWAGRDLSHLFLSSRFNKFHQKIINLILNTCGDSKLKLNLHSVCIVYKNILHVGSTVVKVIDAENSMDVAKG